MALGQALLSVGELRFEDDGNRQVSAFHYDLSWLERPGAFALAPDLPLVEGHQVRSGRHDAPRSALPGPISDGTPDSWGRGVITRSLGHRPNELDLLLLVNDETRQGALRFIDENGVVQSQDRPPVPRRNDLAKLRALARDYESDPALGAQRLRELAGHAGSLGGVRPKSDFDDAGVLAIAKFTSERDTRPVERVEVATLNLACAAGLHAAQARLELPKGRTPVAIVRRFDRKGSARIPYLSAQSFLGRQEAQGGYYTDILDGIVAHGVDPDRQMEELHNRLMFTILVSNNDDHLKNHGFLYVDEGRWVLAPAFDINPQPERHRMLATGISEEYGRTASIEAAVEAAPYFNLTEDRARANLQRIVETISEQWIGHCRAAGMSAREMVAYRPAFDNEETAKARKMTALAVDAKTSTRATGHAVKPDQDRAIQTRDWSPASGARRTGHR